MIDQEFIERCKGKEFQEVVEKYHNDCIQNRRDRWDKWTRNNPERFRQHQAKYYSTEKGKNTARRSNIARRKREKILKSLLSRKQKIEVSRFYANKPDGYHVDHLMPISKGGIHHAGNLQYLTPEENRKKGAKIEKVVYHEPLFDKSQYLNKYYPFLRFLNKSDY